MPSIPNEPSASDQADVVKRMNDRIQREFDAFQEVNSLAEMQHFVRRFPSTIASSVFSRFVAQIIDDFPREDKFVFKKRLDWLRQVASENPSIAGKNDGRGEAAFKAFADASSLEEMQRAVTQYPLLLDPEFTNLILEVVLPKASGKMKLAIQVKLELLHQMITLAYKDFQSANSAKEMQRTVNMWPFMIDNRFLMLAQQLIENTTSRGEQVKLNQRLLWVYQIAERM